MNLNIIKTKFHADIPSDTRTLLQTNRAQAIIKDINGGKFWYYGIEKCISNYFSNKRPPFAELSINIFVDGLPLYKSSSIQFWPILLSLHDMPNVSPMVVGVFCGAKKPGNVEEYLRSLVEELKTILHTGISICGTNMSLKLRAIIADSRARSFIKGVANFNAINGCLKCTCEEEYSHDSHTVIFKGVHYVRRTDNDFRKKVYVTILSTDFYKQNWHVAKEMLIEFVLLYSDIYGDQFITSNVHNPLHIYDEVEFFGALNTLSTYPFENKLQHLKKLLRSRRQDLQQLINRLSELESFHKYEGETQNGQSINFKIQDNHRDGWMLTKQHKIIRFSKMHSQSSSAFHGRVLQEQWNYFEYPFKSSVVNIYVGKSSQFSNTEEVLNFCNIR
uniref:MULE transposase domain-containing protein n=1 Tax=Anopheles epiroticus TaxID=199890 RepID=A0A182PWS7_9DIPT